MDKSDFKVINGGLTFSAFPDDRRFISACITNTRLMGVMVLQIHWKYPHKYSDPDFYQFFYIDCEEDGIESYESLFTKGRRGVDEIMSKRSDCLGGIRSKLSKKQAVAVLKEFAEFTIEAGLPLPGNTNEYSFLLEQESVLSTDELFVLMDKQCEPITQTNQLINYFILRSFGKDYRAIDWLAAENVNLHEVFGDLPGATVHKNSIHLAIKSTTKPAINSNDITESEYADTSDGITYDNTDDKTNDEAANKAFDDFNGMPYNSTQDKTEHFFCETLIENDGRYSIVTSEIMVKDLTVTMARMFSHHSLSPDEVRMILNRAEYVTACDLFVNNYVFTRIFDVHKLKHTATEYPNGILYTFFDKDNSHVCSDEFYLRNDVTGCLFITYSQEVLLAAYDESSIMLLEEKLEACIMDSFVQITGKYEFQEPVLYNFISSDLDSFAQFMELLTTQT